MVAYASHDEFDKAIKGRDVAEADLQRTRMNEVGACRQALRAKAAARSTRERLADTRIVAPFDGYVVKRARDPGNVAVPGDAILQIISLETLWVSAWVDETAMAAVTLGQPALLGDRLHLKGYARGLSEYRRVFARTQSRESNRRSPASEVSIRTIEMPGLDCPVGPSCSRSGGRSELLANRCSAALDPRRELAVVQARVDVVRARQKPSSASGAESRIVLLVQPVRILLKPFEML